MNPGSGLVSGLALFLLLGIVGAVVVGSDRRDRAGVRYQSTLFWTAYGIRFAMSVALYALGLIDLLRDEDGSGWVAGAVYMQDWLREGFGLFDVPFAMLRAYTEQNRGYWYMLGGLFYLTGPSRLAAAALNCFVGSLTIIYTYRIARALFSEYVARRVGLWMVVFPSLIIWSAQTVKEPVVIFLEVLVVYGCVQFQRAAFPVGALLLTMTCIALLLPFRFYAAYLALASVLFSLAIMTMGRRGVQFRPGPLLAVGLVAGLLISTGLLAGRDKSIETFDLKTLKAMKEYDAQTSTSAVRLDYDLETPGGLGMSMIIGAAHLLLAPFPWQLASGSVRMLMVAPEMLFWWWLFFKGLIPGFFFAFRTRLRDVSPLVIMLLGFTTLYSVTFSNVGLVYRQRAQLLPWLFIFAAVGLEQRMLKRASLRLPNAQAASPVWRIGVHEQATREFPPGADHPIRETLIGSVTVPGREVERSSGIHVPRRGFA